MRLLESLGTKKSLRDLEAQIKGEMATFMVFPRSDCERGRKAINTLLTGRRRTGRCGEDGGQYSKSNQYQVTTYSGAGGGLLVVYAI